MLKKKEASLLVYLLLSLSICGCNSSQETDQSKECLTEYNLEVQAVSATNLDKGQVTNLDKKQDIKYSKGQIAPLSDADFMLTNGKKQVALNDLFDEVDVTMEENAFLYGDDSTGVYYRHYKHEEPEYSMIVSNAGYDLSDEPIYTFYIEQLNIEDPSFKTARDITLGDSREKVEVAYGKGVDDSRFNYDCR